MFSRFLQCCNLPDEGHMGSANVVHISSDVMDPHLGEPVHLLTQQDAYDITKSIHGEHGLGSGSLNGTGPSTADGGSSASPLRNVPATPRQRIFKDRIRLPAMRRYPLPPTCSSDDSEETRRQELLRMHQEFVLDLHRGMHVTQLTARQDYADVHAQIMEDLQTLKVDQGSGSIIEFPLGSVTKVYRIVKNDDKWYSAGSLTGPTPMPPLPLSNAEHIVVIEFMRRKLAFVFAEVEAAQNFLICMELLIRRAQELSDQADGKTKPRPPAAASVGANRPGANASLALSSPARST
mmetsp:Transcript_73475/g.175112  ORF Transcript_73475/g.175112 Transcript_73475/m.175112 type:complete len:293 (-) Transcript_73475:17-895(-)